MNIKFKFKLRKTLLKVIEQLEEDKEELENKLKEKEHNNLILLQNASEQRAKIKDLENNIEFLVDNLTPAKRKLIIQEKENDEVL